MLVRVREFMAARAGDFPASSRGAELLAALDRTISALETHATAQTAGLTSAQTNTESKATGRAALIEDLEVLRDTARAIALDNPNFVNNFRLPRGRLTDQQLLATARNFAAEAGPVKAEFIRYGLPADFVEDLNADTESFERAIASQNRSTDTHVAATQAFDDGLDEGGKIVRQLDAVVRNKYRNDGATLAAWTSASHTERAPKHKPQKPNEPPK
jgi:hypothetical protein